jgi:hypothetical protein
MLGIEKRTGVFVQQWQEKELCVLFVQQRDEGNRDF